jgi:methionine-rich copper-binding protein CopC
MKISRVAAASLIAAIVGVLAGGPAWAHNSLVEATPRKDAKLTEAPDEVRLTFLQKLDARYLTIVVSDAQRQKVATAAPKADGKTGIVAFTDQLPNGAYTVAYRVVSTDGHPVQGSYTFTIAGAVTEESPAAPAPVQTSAAASAPATVPVAQKEESSSWLPLGAGVVGVVLIGGIVVFILRRRPQ